MERNPSGRNPSAVGDACERIRKHLDQGAPWEACDAFREAIAPDPGNAELLYWGALAHARSGAMHEAHALLDRAQAGAATSSQRLADILSLRGRLWKDAYHRAPAAADSAAIAERARKEYLAAYALQEDPYPGINAATLSWLLGDRSAAKKLASDIAARIASKPSRNCWDHATEGEALLLLGRLHDARASYAAAYGAAPGDTGSVATMRRQVSLLSGVMPEAKEVLSQLPAADVIAFAGHMIDAPDRAVPRFPAALESVVQQALRQHLAQLRDPIVYSSAACGADLIFIEEALERGAEVNVVLPFDRQDFVRTSVAVAGDDWTRRFDAALARAARVIMATEENHLGDDVLFEHAAMLLEGLTVLRASQLETSPSMLCVIDAEADGKLGGTHASFARWQRQIGAPQTIELRELRARSVAKGPTPTRTASSRAPDAPTPTIATPAARPQRTLKTMLFADFAGFSKLHESVVPLFQSSFWKIAADQIGASQVKPLLANTWGDALYVVFDVAQDGAAFALGFLERMRAVDWSAAGLAKSGAMRVALHAGPVFRGFDPIMNRDSYFGSSVTRAARIEPVTPPGMVYASEAFAATLAATAPGDFSLEYVGRLPLAKGYGESRIYRLERR